MKKVILILSLVLMLSTQAIAGGSGTDHPYIGGSVSWQQVMDSNIDSNDALTDAALRAIDATMVLKDGYGVTGYAGYKWANGFRLEGELSYFRSDPDKASANIGSTKLDGSLDMTAFMVNAIWDFETESGLFPFVGFGAGYGWTSGKFAGGGDVVQGTSNIPLVQPILGVGYRLTNKIAVSLDYKLAFGLKDLDYDQMEMKYRAHRVGLGLRYDF